MTWFEAYVLWQMSSVKTALGVVFVVSLIALATVWIVGLFYHADTFSSDKHKEINKRCIKGTIPLLVFASCLVVLDALIPNTETLLKIIATKKGVDAIQSGTAQNYLSEADKAITNGLKVLNQEIDKKLDKKGKAE